jgi:leader peptidase (prepilin peptidase)/N-methyltransferase
MMTPDQFFAGAAFVFGATLGSFLNVCIARIPYGLSVVYPPSRCPSCMGRIAPWDNVPILAWFWLWGRCRKCRLPISFQYPFVEFLSGACAVHLFLRFGFSWELFYYFFFTASLIILLFIDWRHYILPDEITISGGILGLAGSVWVEGHGLLRSTAGAAVGALGLILLYYGYLWLRKREGLGWGDVKMLFLMGAFLGTHGVLWSVMLASFTALAFALVLAWRHRAGWFTAIPYGTFLGTGGLVFLFFGEQLQAAYWRLAWRVLGN